MSESPAQYAPQPMPTRVTPWAESVQCELMAVLSAKGCSPWIPPKIKSRADMGHRTYGTYLGVGNPGRDGDQDLQDELLDAVVYAYERYLASGRYRYWRMVLQITRILEDCYALDD
jgi:hypothetical protein